MTQVKLDLNVLRVQSQVFVSGNFVSSVGEEIRVIEVELNFYFHKRHHDFACVKYRQVGLEHETFSFVDVIASCCLQSSAVCSLGSTVISDL